MYLGARKNDYGNPVDAFRCETCGGEFTVCPPLPADRSRDDEWTGCMAEQCRSYDPARDANKFFDEGNVLSLVGRRQRVIRVPVRD